MIFKSNLRLKNNFSHYKMAVKFILDLCADFEFEVDN